MKEHDRVVLLATLADQGLVSGDVGTVVHVYPDREAVEVEFITLDGHTTAVATVESAHVRPVTRHDMTHTRQMQPA